MVRTAPVTAALAASWVEETGQWEAWDTRPFPEDGNGPRQITESHEDLTPRPNGRS